MNILVTGGAGFIGAHMAQRHLSDGNRVVVVDNLSTGFREKVPVDARFVQADIADVDLEPLLREEKIDFVSHHAARSTCGTASRIHCSTPARTSSAR